MSDSSPAQHGTASRRLIVSVKRSMTSSKRHGRSHTHSQSMHMYSTPQETSPLPTPLFREESSTSSRPTIEQIAMGLHVSRTPHLHSSTRRQHSRSTSHPSAPSPSPLRSSLKKSGLASSSASASGSSAAVVHTLPLPTTTSTSPSASCSTITSSSLHMTSAKAVKYMSTSAAASSVSPRLQQSATLGSSASALTALKLRMAKLLPGERRRSASSTALGAAATTEIGREKRTGARKAVRFDASGDVGQQG